MLNPDRLLDMVMPDGGASDRAQFEEQLGVENDTDEVKELEQSDLCKPKAMVRASIKSKAAPAAAQQQTASTASSPAPASERSSKSTGVKRKRS